MSNSSARKALRVGLVRSKPLRKFGLVFDSLLILHIVRVFLLCLPFLAALYGLSFARSLLNAEFSFSNTSFLLRKSPPVATLDIESEVSSPPIITPTDQLLYLPNPQSAEIDLVQEISVTAVIPLQLQTLPHLEHALRSLISSYGVVLCEVVLVYPEPLLVAVRKTVRQIMSLPNFWANARTRMQLTLHPRPSKDSEKSTVEGILQAAEHVFGGTILIFGEGFLEELSDVPAVSPMQAAFPIGPRGFSFNHADGGLRCLSPSSESTSALFLVPPFLIPAQLLSQRHPEETFVAFKSWQSFGTWVAQRQAGGAGGVILGDSEVREGHEQSWCAAHSVLVDRLESTVAPDKPHEQPLLQTVSTPVTHGSLGLFITSLVDLSHFSSAACRIVAIGHSLHILYLSPVWDQHANGFGTSETNQCELHYTVRHASTDPNADVFSTWLDDLPEKLDAVITVKEDIHLTALLQALQRHGSSSPHVVTLPRADLKYCDWMGALDLEEWQNWHVPRMEISIITDSRPHSLARLLHSLGEARYFGDSVSFRVNVEQTAGRETIQLVDGFQWEHGPTFVHRRVTHGGLLPAVVEAWYPHSNDSYGVLLEDDIEVSPLFYAWAKLAILRYRYGKDKDQSQTLFGVSLYQQKNVELRPEGRIPFNARQLFDTAGLPHIHTPYLSQIPCSWGAVYFPEHWREFHDYLSLRLPSVSSHTSNSSSPLPLDVDIVPDVRSNKWVRSWKRYFIELVFLRGYTMLYPNFAGFRALSTNHLEAGAHVKPVPRAVYAKKKALFEVPLLPLPASNTSDALMTGLLDLPEARLPTWKDLPVLDLYGELTSEEEIGNHGNDRRAEYNCSREASPYNVYDLLCHTSQDTPFFVFSG